MATDRDFQYDLRCNMQPLLLPACALAAGMFVADAAGVPSTHALAGLVAAATATMVAHRLGSARLAYAAMLLSVMLAGGWRLVAAREAADARPIRALVDTGRIRPADSLHAIGTAEDVPELLPSGARLRVRVSGLTLADGHACEIDGRATVSVRLDDGASSWALSSLGIERGTPLRIAAEAAEDQGFRNPGLETLRTRIRRNGFDLSLRIAGPDAIEVTGTSNGCPVLRRVARIRTWGLDAIDRSFPVRTAGILRALLLGDEAHLDEATAENYRRSGAYHVLVISGAHVALLAGLSLWLVGRATRSPAARLAAGAAPVWLYALVLGGPAPVVRAALGVTVALIAPLAGRRAPPPNTLALAAVIVLVADPFAIRDPSFQLTFAAVAAIVCIAAPLAARFAEVGRWRPHRATPYPPVCGNVLRTCAEALFWEDRRFRTDRRTEAVRFRTAKAAAATWLSRLRLQALIQRVVAGLAIAVIVQVTLSPFAVTSFGRVTLVGTPWALAVEALLALALVAGLGFLAVCAVAPAASGPVEWLAHRLVEASNDVAAAAPAGWPVGAPSGWRSVGLWIAPIAVAVVAAVIGRWHPLPRSRQEMVGPRSPTRRLRVAAVAAFALLVSIGAPGGDRPTDGRLFVLFLDVGQGDAAFVRFPDGTTILVDAGGRPRFDEPLGLADGSEIFAERFEIGDRVVSVSLLAQGFARVDWLVATHGDVDHVGGFDSVIRRMSTDRVVVGAGADAAERAFARSAAERGLGILQLAAGDRIDVGGTRLEVFWPPPNAPPGNDGSLVFRIVHGSRSVLFAGDIEASGESALLALAATEGWDLRADVLKVPHHGSRGASTSGFLASVAPRWAVVSAPRRSPYGHPHPEALARLQSAGAVVLQTGIDGALGFTTDGDEIELLRIAEPSTQLLPPELDHGARSDRTNLPGGPP